MWSPDDAGRGFDRREVERERGRKERERVLTVCHLVGS